MPRFFLLALCVGLIVVLVPTFFLQTRIAVPSFLSPVVGSMSKTLKLDAVMVTTPTGQQMLQSGSQVESDDALAAGVVLEKILTYRAESGASAVSQQTEVNSIAQKLAAAIAANIDDYEIMSFETLITSYMRESKSPPLAISHASAVGPMTSNTSFAAFVADGAQKEILLQEKADALAVATSSAMYKNQQVGITVVLVATEQKNQPTQTPVVTKQVFPNILDTDVTAALNEYRSVHGIPDLIEHPMLCEYAQKRVGDLVAFGGLDAHAGFQKDFADLDNLPAAIKNYPGGRIGENLAFQNCRNMTTGDGFVAQTATALIEWCFDSSTKGHREAQLNPKFTATCTRHQDGLFVVIFGE